MKKINLKKLSFIMGIIFIIGLGGSFITFRRGGNKVSLEEIQSFNSSNINELYVTTINTRINIYPTNEQEIKVSLAGETTRNMNYSLATEADGGVLRVQVEERQIGWLSMNFFGESVELTIYLPRKQYDLLNIDTINGAIRMSGVEVTTMEIESVNGKVELEDIFSEMTSVRNINGRIMTRNLEGDLTAETTNGQIHFISETIDQKMNLRSTNGRILMELEREPENTAFNLSTINGSTTIFGESVREKVFGQGENRVQISTTNGAIQIN